jgi:hypothetical protein
MFLSFFKLFIDCLSNFNKILYILVNYINSDFLILKNLTNMIIIFYPIFLLKGGSILSKIIFIIYINLKKYIQDFIYKYIMSIKSNILDKLMYTIETFINNINKYG